MPPRLLCCFQRASRWGALCFYAFFVAPAFHSNAWAADASCKVKEYDEKVLVRHVVDGDTVVLEDGRHVRIIGINAPERARKERISEPFAERALSALQNDLVSPDSRLLLRFGVEREDRYGRLLAHLFLPGGEHLGVRLVRKGVAAAIAVPPNLGFQKCLRTAERQARDKELGIWRLARFQGREISTIGPSETGFMSVRGHLDGVGFSRDALWLQIGGRLGVRIDKSNLKYFRRWNFHALQGEELIVRGWLTRRKNRPRMQLKHPNDMEIVVR